MSRRILFLPRQLIWVSITLIHQMCMGWGFQSSALAVFWPNRVAWQLTFFILRPRRAFVVTRIQGFGPSITRLHIWNQSWIKAWSGWVLNMLICSMYIAASQIFLLKRLLAAWAGLCKKEKSSKSVFLKLRHHLCAGRMRYFLSGRFSQNIHYQHELQKWVWCRPVLN